MNITILTTSIEHPVNSYLDKWVIINNNHKIDIVHSRNELTSGDILFLISCSEIISQSEIGRYKKTFVVHASDLPYGRGWSPHVWEIINGANSIILSLFEAQDKVDTGDIWKKISINIPKTSLYYEINELIFNSELELMDFAIENFDTMVPEKAPNIDTKYWPKRTPKDSLIDINKTISEQFDLIRVCDPQRFPAYFYIDGIRFDITIEKCNE